MQEINDDNFQEEVLNSSDVVLVDFWAPWCKPCMMLSPIIDGLSVECSGKAKFCKMNIDESPKTAESLGIMSIPTLKLFKAGKEVDELVGLQSKESIHELLEKHVPGESCKVG